jgi:hypothetical protein
MNLNARFGHLKDTDLLLVEWGVSVWVIAKRINESRSYDLLLLNGLKKRGQPRELQLMNSINQALRLFQVR